MHSVNSPLGSVTNIKTLTSEENFHRIIHEIENAKHVPQDWKDHSEHPSYSYFAKPFVWLHRYEKSRTKYEKQFQREFATTLEQQESAHEAVRFVRHLAITSLWPPLHTHLELEYTRRNFFRISRKQRERLQFLKSNKII